MYHIKGLFIPSASHLSSSVFCRMWRYFERWSWASWKEGRTSTRPCASSLASTAMRSSRASRWLALDRYDMAAVLLSMFRALETTSTAWSTSGFLTLIICVLCLEKSSGHSFGGGAERAGTADDECGRQLKSGLATQLPYPQHVQRGQRGHLHQRVRRETLAGQRSVVILSMFINETGIHCVCSSNQISICPLITLLVSRPSRVCLYSVLSLSWCALSPQHSLLCLPVSIFCTLPTSF